MYRVVFSKKSHKGTTKNAHTQAKRAFFEKIIDLQSIEYVHLLLVGNLLTNMRYSIKAKPANTQIGGLLVWYIR
jgi:hypothetical protein